MRQSRRPPALDGYAIFRVLACRAVRSRRPLTPRHRRTTSAKGNCNREHQTSPRCLLPCARIRRGWIDVDGVGPCPRPAARRGPRRLRQADLTAGTRRRGAGPVGSFCARALRRRHARPDTVRPRGRDGADGPAFQPDGGSRRSGRECAREPRHARRRGAHSRRRHPDRHASQYRNDLVSGRRHHSRVRRSGTGRGKPDGEDGDGCRAIWGRREATCRRRSDQLLRSGRGERTRRDRNPEDRLANKARSDPGFDPDRPQSLGSTSDRCRPGGRLRDLQSRGH